MKREAMIITAVLAVVFAVVTCAGAQSAEPALTVEESRIDLGEIKAGTDAIATYVFHNSGATDVRIIKAKPS